MNTTVKNSKGLKIRQIITYFSLMIGIFLLLTAASCPPNNGPSIKKVYVMAFTESGSDRIRISWSENGQTWTRSNNFPNQTTTIGVGATSSANGALNVVFWGDSSNKLQAVWGLGTNVWDSSPTGPTLNQDLLSAPEAAYAGDNIYLVAFRVAGDSVAVRALNVSSRQWLSTSLAPAHTNNSNVFGRPAISVLGGKVMLAWSRSGSIEIAYGNLQIATVGGQRVPVINWTNIYTFPQSETGFGPPRSEPALTHDGTNFHLGFIRRTLGGPLQADWLFIYPSSDGTSWGNAISKGTVPLNSFFDIAGRSDGSILAAFVAPATSSTSMRVVHKFSGGSWTQILDSSSSTSDTVFGFMPIPKSFALIANKP